MDDKCEDLENADLLSEGETSFAAISCRSSSSEDPIIDVDDVQFVKPEPNTAKSILKSESKALGAKTATLSSDLEMMTYELSSESKQLNKIEKEIADGLPRFRSSMYGNFNSGNVSSSGSTSSIFSDAAMEGMPAEHFDFDPLLHARSLNMVLDMETWVDEYALRLKCNAKVKLYSLIKDKKQQVAVKTVRTKRLEDAKRLEYMIKTWSALRHPHIVELHSLFEQGPFCYGVVMENGRGGDLLALINKAIRKGELTGVSSEVAKSMLNQMLSALAYLHENQVAHRDLKPQNCVLEKGGTPTINCVVKLIDFTFARDVSETDGVMTTQVGTWRYAAPEVLEGKPYRKECDVYSLGCTMFTLCCCELPYDALGLSCLLDQIAEGIPPKFELPAWKKHNSKLLRVTRRMLEPDPELRLSAQALLEKEKWLRQGEMCCSAQ
eukprot:TRINITY_DN55658_c0_g1_i1.p1 TRINITY_DN55658_c0_g1~~TRINITY_DN55658_c0_g1_i1.p1  ORF type:complete len:448 (+),score=73.96 TRINITY_DN55658_c0_g1_i1:35-1345(+)